MQDGIRAINATEAELFEQERTFSQHFLRSFRTPEWRDRVGPWNKPGPNPGGATVETYSSEGLKQRMFQDHRDWDPRVNRGENGASRTSIAQ